ncbi:MAG: hypothetical protein PUD08_12370 [bacterium]|nr:hypothetical protein [bacterium]MDY4844743.1 hypothetical protein [Parabacteroides sp.]
MKITILMIDMMPKKYRPANNKQPILHFSSRAVLNSTTNQNIDHADMMKYSMPQRY